jgi:5-methylcytosine-specific restriction endonuclease McrA
MNETEYPKEYPCPKCGITYPFTPRADTPHFGAIRCHEHGYIWIRRPTKDKKPRRKAKTNLIKILPKQNQDFCWFCLRNKSVLQSLKPSLGFEVHHVNPVDNGGTDEPSNLMLLCSECHAEAHRRQEAFKRYTLFVDLDKASE